MQPLLNYLSFSFLLVLLILTNTLKPPIEQNLESVVSLSYIVSSVILLFVGGIEQLSRVKFGFAFRSISAKRQSALMHFAVFFMAIILSAYIFSLGGITRSPYAAFLSAFPVFCVLLIYRQVSVMSFLMVGLIFLAPLVAMQVVHNFVIDLAPPEDYISKFVESGRWDWLALGIIIITVVSNLISAAVISHDNAMESK